MVSFMAGECEEEGSFFRSYRSRTFLARSLPDRTSLMIPMPMHANDVPWRCIGWDSSVVAFSPRATENVKTSR